MCLSYHINCVRFWFLGCDKIRLEETTQTTSLTQSPHVNALMLTDSKTRVYIYKRTWNGIDVLNQQNDVLNTK